MSQDPSAPNSEQDQNRMILVLIVLFVLIIWLFYALSEEMKAFGAVVSYIHMYPFAMIAEHLPIVKKIPLLGDWLFMPAEKMKGFLDRGNFAYMDGNQTYYVLTAGGRCALPLYAPFLIFAGIKGQQFRPDRVYRTPYSLEKMIWTQSEHWLTSRGVRHVNPLRLPEVSTSAILKKSTEIENKRSKDFNSADCGELIPIVPQKVSASPWHRAMRPEEWLVATGMCRDHDHMVEAAKKDWKYPDQKLEARQKWENLSIESLSEVLAGQLRRPWTKFEDLRPSHQAICAVMASFYDYNVDGGNKILNELGAIQDSVKSTAGAMDAAIVAEEAVYKKIMSILTGKPGQQLKKEADKHAWLETAFPAMLAISRKDRGVLPAAAFLWIKFEDRPLWYILDNVGSEAVMIESAGAMAHWKAEKQIGKPIRRPAVYQAARALLEDYLDITPERVESRKTKAERSLQPGHKIDRIFNEEDT
jgi:hypothetical protein